MDLNAPQASYARWLARGMRIGFIVLAIAFGLYMLGAPPLVPIERLPEVWQRPAVAAGWRWAMQARSDTLVIGAIALLASCSIPALIAAALAFGKGRERALAWICALQVAVLVLAASGVLALGH